MRQQGLNGEPQIWNYINLIPSQTFSVNYLEYLTLIQVNSLFTPEEETISIDRLKIFFYLEKQFNKERLADTSLKEG
ncbi:unnamed protein product [Paramecium primaurelia]|uniref:Uncharacterized protein n=1 Tax=Paramecium primaurelia TaxID=5886 RepID=A0A8S1PKF6_PARPR|nr:unnamed protein product [Paramecium primaurelia]